jgi:hypothetical protein
MPVTTSGLLFVLKTTVLLPSALAGLRFVKLNKAEQRNTPENADMGRLVKTKSRMNIILPPAHASSRKSPIEIRKFRLDGTRWHSS